MLTLRTSTAPIRVGGIRRTRGLIDWYETNVRYGPTYYQTPAASDANNVTIRDLGYAVLFVGRPTPRAARSLLENPVRVNAPTAPLAALTPAETAKVTTTITDVAKLPGLACALATKILHKKRPHTIPVMDNKAIFQTYLNATWIPGMSAWPKQSLVVRSSTRIEHALTAIAADLSDPSNQQAWEDLERAVSRYTRVELFDMIWWALAHAA